MSISWTTGADSGVTAFDIQLHNFNKTIMRGFIPVAQRVPLKRFESGTKKGQIGGELGVKLDWIPTGYVIITSFEALIRQGKRD